MTQLKKGRPSHKVTAEKQTIVKTLAAVGTTYEDIASKLKISSDTLVKYYPVELAEGRIDANAKVAKSLYDQATTGNTTAAIFWLKTRAKWKETDRHEHVGDNDAPMEMVVQWKDK